MPSKDVQDLSDVLDAVSDRVPPLLRSVLDQLYSPEAGRKMGQAIGAFYRELTEAGLPPERALKLAEQYASPFGIVNSLMGNGPGHGMSMSWSHSHTPSRRSTRAAPSPTPKGPADLEACFNNTGTSDDEQPERADLDGAGWSLSRRALAAAGAVPGATLELEGVSFRWPGSAPGQPDNVEAEGQQVRLPNRPGATRLGILGLATNGPSIGLATLRYSDGRTQPFALGLPDWTLNGGEGELSIGTRVAVRMPRRNGDEDTDVETLVFATILPLQADRVVETLILPERVDQGALHIFAVALAE